jgi:hypothetical protein
MSIIVIGIDLAKSAFAAHGVDQSGIPELLPSRLFASEKTWSVPYFRNSLLSDFLK